MTNLTININSHPAAYPIVINQGLLAELNKHVNKHTYSSIFVVTDKNILKLYGKQVSKQVNAQHIIAIEPGENDKSLATVRYIWQQLNLLNADRKSLVVNLGGGVVSDIGGFAASTYMRGLDFINIPTTLLSAADASIGGKTGFNFEGIKNLVGSFAQPKAVLIDVDTFKTLDDRTFNEGLAEIIKHAAVFDESYFKQLHDVLPKPNQKQLTEILYKSCQIKADTVSKDEKEAGQRKLLNFGHTIGHAVESLSYEAKAAEPLLHGEAVSIGMVAEAKLGEKSGFTEAGTSDKLKLLLEKVNLPTAIPSWAKDSQIEQKVLKDKKNQSQKLLWVMLRKIGEASADISLPG